MPKYEIKVALNLGAILVSAQTVENIVNETIKEMIGEDYKFRIRATVPFIFESKTPLSNTELDNLCTALKVATDSMDGDIVSINLNP